MSIEQHIANLYSARGGSKTCGACVNSVGAWDRYWAHDRKIMMSQGIKVHTPKLTIKEARHFDITTSQGTLISIKEMNVSKAKDKTVDFAAGNRGYYEMLHILRSPHIPNFYVEFVWWHCGTLMSAITDLKWIWNVSEDSDMTKRGYGDSILRLPEWAYPEKVSFHPKCFKVGKYVYPRMRWKPFAKWSVDISQYWIKEPSPFDPSYMP
tara:strand:+ start:434 stop:1060 length:627 start_codon:yes stop_codon:yes gene_type:complete